jgi:hypothetical protein
MAFWAPARPASRSSAASADGATRPRGRSPSSQALATRRSRDALGLHFGQRVAELPSFLHRGQDVLRRAVDDAPEPDDADGGQRLAGEVEDGDAVHDGAFEQEGAARGGGAVRERAVGKGGRPLVRGDRVRPARQRGFDVRDGGLAGADVEDGRLDDHRAPGREGIVPPALAARVAGRPAADEIQRVVGRHGLVAEAAGRVDAAVPPRRDADHPPVEPVPGSQPIALLLEQPDEAPPDVAETHEEEVEHADGDWGHVSCEW